MSHLLLRRYPSLYDLVYLSSHLYESEGFLQCGYKEAIPPWSALSRAYIAAKDSDFLWRQGLFPANPKTADRLLITTCFSVGPDDPLLLLCIRNRKPSAKSPWYAERFIARSAFENNGQFMGIPEGEWLRSWAVIRRGETNDYFGALAELGNLTHSGERWYFGTTEDVRYPILGNYLRYVFYKLWLDNCICYSADEQLAAFNTGLVNNQYDFIYAVFERIPPVYGKMWNLKGFCIAGEQGLGKELLRQFNPVPRPARFFTHTGELIYEINYDLPLSAQLPYVDYSHIIHDNLDRFPLSFLRSACFGYQKIQELLEQVSAAASKPESDELWEKIDLMIDDELFLRIKGQIDRSLHIAMRRVMWNYKTAIPVYFPVRNAISWLLPLALSAGSQADVALVVERFPNGNMEGHTILDLDMAYTNARLISKPESDWLSPDIIKMGSETRFVIESEKPEPAAIPWPAAELSGTDGEDTPPPASKPVRSSKAAPAKKISSETKPKKKDPAARKPEDVQPLSKETAKKTSCKKADSRKPSPLSALEVLHSQLGKKPVKKSQLQELAGQRIILPVVSARKKHKGLQGIYQGVVVTISQKLLSKELSAYAGKPLEVVITGVNPQGTQYTAEPVAKGQE